MTVFTSCSLFDITIREHPLVMYLCMSTAAEKAALSPVSALKAFGKQDGNVITTELLKLGTS